MTDNDFKVRLKCFIEPGRKCQTLKEDAEGETYIERCSAFTKLLGVNPQTGEQFDEYGCAVSWLPLLFIENTKQQLSTASAVESFRNEMVKANRTTQNLLATTTDKVKLIEDDNG
jgi:hypothetical protein